MERYYNILREAWALRNSSLKVSEGELVTYFEGDPGAGKTAVINCFAKEIDAEIITMNLNVTDPSDLTGIPYQKDGVMQYSMPFFMNMKRGILFLDELNRVNSPEIKAGLLSLMVDRKLNGHALSPEVLLVAAGNFVDDRNETVEFDGAFKDRIIRYEFRVDWEEWLEYIELVHPSSDLLNFYRFAGSKQLGKFSYRRLEYVLNHYEINRNANYIGAGLSMAIASGFQQFIDNKLYSFKDMLDGKPLPKRIEPAVERAILEDFLITASNPDSLAFPSNRVKVWAGFLDNARAETLQDFCNKVVKMYIETPQIAECVTAYGKEHKLLRPIKEEMFSSNYIKK